MFCPITLPYLCVSGATRLLHELQGLSHALPYHPLPCTCLHLLLCKGPQGVGVEEGVPGCRRGIISRSPGPCQDVQGRAGQH